MAGRSGASVNESGSTLIATWRFSLVSVARYTSPIPPTPIWATTSYGPMQVPEGRDTRESRRDTGRLIRGKHRASGCRSPEV
jgi:hypothetical protein